MRRFYHNLMRSDRYFRLLSAAIVAGFMVFQGCGGVRHDADISFVDREAASTVQDPLALVIGIDSSGKLTLNHIETGTVGDPALLNEKLRTIFDDRRRLSINQNEVLIEMVGTIAYEDIDALITSLKPLQPSRITVITR